MNRTQVTVQTATKRETDEGMTDSDWADMKTLSGIFLPASGDLAFRIHGVEITASARFYCRARSEYLVAGNRLIARGKTYLITYVADYIKMLDVWLNEVRE